MNNPLGQLAEGMPIVLDEPVLAWRQWAIANGDLMSFSSDCWPYRKPFEAVCNLRQHEAPIRECSCGIYAAHTLSTLGESGYSIEKSKSATILQATGRVKLWGKLIPHERGWRAQYAYPDLVIVNDELVGELVRRNYGCEVIIPDITPETPPPQNIQTLIEALPNSPIDIGVNLSFNIYGRFYTYNGPADITAVGRWFGTIIAQEGKVASMNQTYMMPVQMQISYMRLN